MNNIFGYNVKYAYLIGIILILSGIVNKYLAIIAFVIILICLLLIIMLTYYWDVNIDPWIEAFKRGYYKRKQIK